MMRFRPLPAAGSVAIIVIVGAGLLFAGAASRAPAQLNTTDLMFMVNKLSERVSDLEDRVRFLEKCTSKCWQ